MSKKVKTSKVAAELITANIKLAFQNEDKEKRSAELIITDISMPVLDGFEFLDKLKRNKKLSHIPVIAYSASVMNDQKDHILVSKFAGLLIKPVLVTDLFHELMKNLKYKTIKSLSWENTDTEKTHSEEISCMSGMMHSLKNHFNDICKSFEIIQPIDEVSDFGNQLF
jgi:CheY-like chemotaxis protein